MSMMDFIRYAEKSFGNKVGVVPGRFKEGYPTSIGWLEASILGQAIHFVMVYTEKTREWLLAGIQRKKDALGIFRTQNILVAIPKNNRGQPQVFVKFRLLLFKDELILGIFADKGLLNAFYVKDLIPQSAESKQFSEIRFQLDTREFMFSGEDFRVRIALKKDLADKLDYACIKTPLEGEYKSIQIARSEAEHQEQLDASEAEKIRLKAEKNIRRKEMEGRPCIKAYKGEAVLSGTPVTVEEYVYREHYVLPDGTWIIVVRNYDVSNGRASNPIKHFVLNKKRGGRVQEEAEQTSLSLEKPRALEISKAMTISDNISVDWRGKHTLALVLNEEQVRFIRETGTYHGTFFVRKGKTRDDGRREVYQFIQNGVHTVGLLPEVQT